MKAKHWLFTGAGCIAASILLGVATMLIWMNQISASFNKGEPLGSRDPFQGIGIMIVATAFINLLFLGGVIVLIIGFIKLAKEPNDTSNESRNRD